MALMTLKPIKVLTLGGSFGITQNQKTEHMIKPFLTTLAFLVCFGLSAQNNSMPMGNWYASDGSNTWMIGLYEQYAVYDAEFWYYKEISRDGKKVTWELDNGANKRRITLWEAGDGLVLREDTDMKRLRKERLGEDRLRVPSKEVYTGDFLEPGQVELKGIIEPRDTMPLTASVIYTGAFSESQSKFTVDVDEMGRFKLTFPLSNPLSVMLQVGDAFFTFLSEPGAKQALYIKEASFNGGFDSWYEEKDILFMGDLAQENEEHRVVNPEYMKVRNYFENDSMITALGPMEYLEYRTQLWKDHQQFYNDYFKQFPASQKVVNYAEREVRLYAANDLMRYRWLHGRGPNGSITPVDLPADYEKVVTELISNDPKDMMAGEYGWLMRELTLGMMPRERAETHQRQLAAAYEFLKGKVTSEADKALLAAWHTKESQRENTRGIVKMDTIKALKEPFEAELKDLKATIQLDIVLDRLSKYDQLPKSCALSIYIDQNYFYRGLEVPEHIWEKLMSVDLQPVVRAAMQAKFDNFKILKEKKFVEGIEIAEAEDDILSQLKKKHEGKVIYIDVWATWCGPCLSEFNYLKNLKANFEDRDDVVFVYLCAQSKSNGWKTMVKKYELTGDNYFLDDAKFSRLDKAVNISGFPTYMVITKEGKLVRHGIKRPSSDNQVVNQLKEFAGRE